MLSIPYQVEVLATLLNVVFEQTANGHAVTEGGSSGSPLFNQNKQIVGTLSGGSSSCEKPNGANTYGKLYRNYPL